MSLEGTVINGAIVCSEPLALADGTVVEIVPKPGETKNPPLGKRLLKLAGLIKEGLPEDMAAEHDHYLHGAPRRAPKRDE